MTGKSWTQVLELTRGTPIISTSKVRQGVSFFLVSFTFTNLVCPVLRELRVLANLSGENSS